MKAFDSLMSALLIVGGLNWGLVGIFEFDLVAWIVGEDFGQTNAASRIIYILVGVAAVYGLLRGIGLLAKHSDDRRADTRGGGRPASTTR